MLNRVSLSLNPTALSDTAALMLLVAFPKSALMFKTTPLLALTPLAS